MDGTEASCLVIFGIPTQDTDNTNAKLGKLISRARNSVVVITEEVELRLQKEEAMAAIFFLQM